MAKNTLPKLLLAAVLVCTALTANAQKKINLFNGKDLSNWNFVIEKDAEPADKVYSIVDGVINIKGSPLGYMYTKEKYADFILHVEWRWPNGVASNSGIFLLIEDPKNPFPNGIECQLQAGNAGDFVMLGGSNLKEYSLPAGQERPKFPIIRKCNTSSEKPAGEWNSADISVKDGVINVYVNGVHQNFATNTVKSGHIGLQSEGKAVQFRNVTLMEW